MFKRSKKLVIGLLIMLSVMVSGFTYAYWASNVLGDSDNAVGTVNVSTGEEVTINAVVGSQGGSALSLVPSGFVIDPLTQDDEIIISFTVEWVNDNRLTGIADANISVAINNIEVNGVANPSNLISVVEQVGNPTTISLGSTVTFYFVITMGTPANQAEYNSVAGLPITFDLTFTVNPN